MKYFKFINNEFCTKPAYFFDVRQVIFYKELSWKLSAFWDSDYEKQMWLSLIQVIDYKHSSLKKNPKNFSLDCLGFMKKKKGRKRPET